MNDNRTNEFSDRFDRAGKVFLLTTGSAGTTFLQSLFDFHPHILMVPTILKAYSLFNETKNMSADDMASFIINKSKLKYIFHKKKTSTIGDFSNYQISRNIFKNEFRKYWGMGIRNEKRFLESAHYAFMMATGKIMYDFNTVFVHFHCSQDISKLLNDYPDAKWLLMVRNPISMFYSNFVRHKTYNSYVLDIFGYDNCWMKALLEFDVGHTILEFENFTKLEKLRKDRYFIIKNEELHSNLEGVIKDLTMKIGIKFNDSMLSSTIGGVPYVSTTALNKDIWGASKKLLEPKHKNELSEKDILFLETYYKKELKKYKYSFETSADFNKEQMYKYKIANKNLLYKVRFVFQSLERLNNDIILPHEDDRTILQAYIERHIVLRIISKMSGDRFVKVLLTVYLLMRSIKENRKLRNEINGNIDLLPKN